MCGFSTDNELAPPGAGIPFWQRWTGRFLLLPVYCRRLTRASAAELLVREGRALLARSEALDAARLERPVLVPPQIGLEDSSRCWSWAMVVEHLTIFGRWASTTIERLDRGEAPEGELRIADLKPGIGCEVARSVLRYRAFLDTFPAVASAREGSSGAKSPHPWFGPLDAHEWICFLPLHQRIHARQVERILE